MTINVFQQAGNIVYGDREQTYGHPAKNLKVIAEQWQDYLFHKTGAVVDLTAEDVCWMMALLKMARQMNQYKRDNLVDAIGYIGLIDRLEKNGTD